MWRSSRHLRGIYAAYQRTGADDVFEQFVPVEDDWECTSYPLARYPPPFG
jgi:hypothetical protein